MENQLLYVNKEYESFEAFFSDFQLYQNNVQQDFQKSHSTVLKPATSELVYQKIEYNCVYGPKRPSQSTGVREARYFSCNI